VICYLTGSIISHQNDEKLTELHHTIQIQRINQGNTSNHAPKNKRTGVARLHGLAYAANERERATRRSFWLFVELRNRVVHSAQGFRCVRCAAQHAVHIVERTTSTHPESLIVPNALCSSSPRSISLNSHFYVMWPCDSSVSKLHPRRAPLQTSLLNTQPTKHLRTPPIAFTALTCSANALRGSFLEFGSERSARAFGPSFGKGGRDGGGKCRTVCR
jgi:hypothetical protein